MQKLILFALLIFTAMASNAQTNKYKKEWQQADTLIIKKSLPKSALVIVNNIYNRAKKDGDAGEMIKALYYKFNLEDKSSDKEINEYVQAIGNEIKTTREPVAKSLLYALQAQQLINYKNNNGWRIRQRAEAENTGKADILTWNASDFNKRIAGIFDTIFVNAGALKQAQLKDYSAVIEKGNTPGLRLTMYDVLVNYKLDYYKNNDDLAIKPENEFLLNKPEYFSPAERFIQLPLQTADTLSSKQIAVETFQDLLKYYLANNATSALVDADVNRIAWMYQHATAAGKDTLYVQALENILKKHPDNKYTKEAAYLLAQYYFDMAGKYEMYKDSTHRLKYITALDIINKFIPSKDSTSAVAALKNLRQQILNKSVETTTENINVPGKPMRALLKYKNTDQLFVRVIKWERTSKENFYNNDIFWKAIVKNKNIVQSFMQKLPLPQDYQYHFTEIKIDALPIGRYVLLTSDDADFSIKSKLSARLFDVSDLAYVQNEGNYFVLNRETGKPVPGAVIHFQTGTKNLAPIYTTVTTDSKGYAKAPPLKTTGRGYISKDGDRIEFDGHYYYYSNEKSVSEPEISSGQFEHDEAKAHFFTDRSLYRPGQTVYFKGILTTLEQKTKQKKLYNSPGKINVRLYDANNKIIDSVYVKANEFSSFSGSFKLPLNVLTGSFFIDTEELNGTVHFNVEEYKRPTFFVELDTLKTDYRLNDSITVTGTAKAFAGNTIDNAQVKINVTRLARYPYPWLWRGFMPNRPSAQIHNEIVTTDANGKFSFTFKAVPDESIDKNLKPIFNYQVEAAITDNNGETREANTSISIGYQSLILEIENDENGEAGKFKAVNVKATNLSDQEVPATVTVKIYALEMPGRLIRKRYWQRPDQFVMDKQTYLSYFPHDEYDNETDKASWNKVKEVYSKTSEANENKAFSLGNTKLAPGWYLVEATAKDKNGNDVENRKYIRIYNDDAVRLTEKEYLWVSKVKSAGKIGEQDIFKIGTAAEDVHILQAKKTAMPREKSGIVFSDFKLNNEIKTIVQTTTANDLNASSYVYGFIKHNRLYTTDNTVMVTDSTKNLEIAYATFRDKTEPGAKEKWQIKISGQNNKKVEAELLSSMYDASLDEIRLHEWHNPFITNTQIPHHAWNTDYRQFTAQSGFTNADPYNSSYGIKAKIYDHLIFSDRYYFMNPDYGNRRGIMIRGLVKEEYDKEFTTVQLEARYKGDAASAGNLKDIHVISSDNAQQAASPDAAPISVEEEPAIQQPLRTNFNETAFFMPHVYAGKDGSYTLEFTMPDAMTKWKWMNLAYTKTMQHAYSEKEIVSQKTMMVQPNLPRFLRAGDKAELSAKISNLSENNLDGIAQIQILNAITREPITGWTAPTTPVNFKAAARQSTSVKFPVTIPADATEPILIKIAGSSGKFSDGEEHIIPVLTNKMLVTEAMPVFQQGDTTINYTFDKLKNHTSNTLQTQSLTVEFTANPVWYAVQSLPYLMEYPYDCAEQVFNRFYANALATHIVNTKPGIKQIFNEWLKDSTALQSNLQKNQELKQILLQETPWLVQAENETEQRKNIALLFDLAKMSEGINKSINQLSDMQLADGSFPWFKGGDADRYITQYILTGIGRLKTLEAVPANSLNTLNQITAKARQYLRNAITKDYNDLKKYSKDLTKHNVSGLQIHYLFANSYFDKKPATAAEKYFYGQAKKYWIDQSSYFKGMLAGIFYRNNEKVFAKETILKSLLENAVEDKVQGTYWKDMQWGYYWYQVPIEQQALMIEVTHEIAEGENNHPLRESVNGMQNWLIRNKQTNNWRTTKATADACYALLKVNNLIGSSKNVVIQLGNNTTISTEKGQAGAGYVKQTFTQQQAGRDMADIKVTTSSNDKNNVNRTPAYGSVYWQYFEEMDKITPAATPLSLKKQLFIEKNTGAGKKLLPVNNGDVLNIGDKVVVRVELKSDRDMEYLHLKDMRAASMEPVNVLSGYKWQDGLGYYEATKDASTNFFISYLRKGTYVFDYPLHITHSGDYSVGTASIQCMYAPEFTSHSAGLRIKVK